MENKGKQFKGNGIKKYIKEDWEDDLGEEREDVVEYIISFEPGELYDEYGGEFITDDKGEADDLFDDLKEEHKLDQVSEYIEKTWEWDKVNEEYYEGDVDVYFYAGDELEVYGENKEVESKDVKTDKYTNKVKKALNYMENEYNELGTDDYEFLYSILTSNGTSKSKVEKALDYIYNEYNELGGDDYNFLTNILDESKAIKETYKSKNKKTESLGDRYEVWQNYYEDGRTTTEYVMSFDNYAEAQRFASGLMQDPDCDAWVEDREAAESKKVEDRKIEAKQVNNMKIKYNKIYDKYDVITPDGRALEEFDTEEEAIEWAKEQRDFIKKKEEDLSIDEAKEVGFETNILSTLEALAKEYNSNVETYSYGECISIARPEYDIKDIQSSIEGLGFELKESFKDDFGNIYIYVKDDLRLQLVERDSIYKIFHYKDEEVEDDEVEDKTQPDPDTYYKGYLYRVFDKDYNLLTYGYANLDDAIEYAEDDEDAKYIEKLYYDGIINDNLKEGDIIWEKDDEDLDESKKIEGYSLGDDKESFDVYKHTAEFLNKVGKALEDLGWKFNKSTNKFEKEDITIDMEALQDSVDNLYIGSNKLKLSTLVDANSSYEDIGEDTSIIYYVSTRDDDFNAKQLASKINNCGRLEEGRRIIESKLIVTNIKWDTDGEDIDLPKEMEVELPEYIDETDEDEVNEYVSDYISDETGFCHYGFDIKEVKTEAVMTSNKVSVYQIQETANCSYLFMGYDFAVENGGPDMNDYEKVAEVEIDTRDTDVTYVLDEVFTYGNTNIEYYDNNPKARSISVSDILEYNGNKYYVDSFGFKKLEDTENKQVKTEDKQYNGISLSEAENKCKEVEKLLAEKLPDYNWLVNISAGQIIISDLNSKSDFRYTKKNGWGKSQKQVEDIISQVFGTTATLDFYDSDVWAKHKAIVKGINILLPTNESEEKVDYSKFTPTNKVLSGNKGLSEDKIDEMRWALPDLFKNMTDEQKQIFEELSLREMVMSCLVYGDDIHTAENNVSLGKYRGKSYVAEYYDTLGKDVTEEIIKQQTDYFNRGKVIKDVGTDSEGVTYNSFEEPEEESKKVTEAKYGDSNPDKIVPDAYCEIEKTDKGYYINCGIGDHTNLGSGNFTIYPEDYLSNLHKEVKKLAKERGIKRVYDKVKTIIPEYNAMIPEYNDNIENMIKDLTPFAEKSKQGQLTRADLDSIEEITGKITPNRMSTLPEFEWSGKFGKLRSLIGNLERYKTDLSNPLASADTITITESKEVKTEAVNKFQTMTTDIVGNEMLLKDVSYNNACYWLEKELAKAGSKVVDTETKGNKTIIKADNKTKFEYDEEKGTLKRLEEAEAKIIESLDIYGISEDDLIDIENKLNRYVKRNHINYPVERVKIRTNRGAEDYVGVIVDVAGTKYVISPSVMYAGVYLSDRPMRECSWVITHLDSGVCASSQEYSSLEDAINDVKRVNDFLQNGEFKDELVTRTKEMQDILGNKKTEAKVKRSNKQLDYKLDGFKGVTISVVDKKNGIDTEDYFEFDSMEFGIDEYEFKDSMVDGIKDVLTNLYEFSDVYYDDVFTEDEIDEMAEDITQDVLQLYDDLPEENIDREKGIANLDESKEVKTESKEDTKYIVCSYYDEKLHGLEDDLYTNEWEDVEEFAHRKLMQGNMIEIENTKTGKSKRINPDEYNKEFDGEFIVRQEELDEDKKITEAEDLKAKADAVKEKVEKAKADIGLKKAEEMIDTEKELTEGIKKEIIQYAKQQGLDVEKLQKQGQLDSVAEALDNIIGEMVSKTAVEYMDTTGKDIEWDFDISNNDIQVIIQ